MKARAALSMTLLTGCAWGLRGGPEVGLRHDGAALTQARVTASAGLGATSGGDDGVSDGFLVDATLRAGYESPRDAALSGTLGLSWFHVPERARWGWGVGTEWGLGGAVGAPVDVVAVLRGGPTFRVASRRFAWGRLLLLQVEAFAALSLPAARDAPDAAGRFGVALTVGVLDVHRFHL